MRVLCSREYPKLTVGKYYKVIKVKGYKTYIHKDNGKLEWIDGLIRFGIDFGIGNDTTSFCTVLSE